MAWYTSRTYYRVSLAVPIVLGLFLAAYILIVDRLNPCADPFGITETCIASRSCNIDHCRLMNCKGSEMCVPEVKSTCFIGRQIFEPDECPLDRYPYSLIFTAGYIGIALVIAFLYIGTRIYIRIEASETYERYPSVLHASINGGGETCPTCGTHGVVIGVECTNCNGSGMHEGTMRPITCDVCDGKGRILSVSPN